MITTNNKLRDFELITRAQSGDATAEQDLLMRYTFLVATIIARHGYFLPSGTKDDVMQHGFLGLLAAIRTFKDGRGAQFKTYASVCIRNEILGAIRGANVEKSLPLNTALSLDGDTFAEQPITDQNTDSLQSYEVVDRTPTPDEVIIAREFSSHVAQLLTGHLTSKELQVFKSHAHGYSYAEIGLMLKMTPKAVDSTLQRVRRKMSHLL